MMSGAVTRKEIIEDEAIKWGLEYSKNVEVAVKSNKELVESIKEISKISSSYLNTKSQQEFISLKQQETLEFNKSVNAIKLEEQALKAAEKAKQEILKTRKLELDAIGKEETARKRTTKLSIEERVQLEANNRALKQAAREKLGLVSAYDKLNNKRTEAKKKLRDLIATEDASTKSIQKAQTEFDRLDAKVKRADDAVRDFTKNVGNYPKLNAFAGGLKNLVGAFGLVGGVTAFATVVKGAIATVKEFDQSIADLQAITGASGNDLQFLKKNAIDMGKGVKGGAVAVVEAYKLIASAKPELLENVDALNAVTKATITLSKASGIELPEAASALTDAMNQFGADASLASEFVDTLANGARYGAAEIPDITDALLKFGAVAKSSNVSIAESTALIELLAEKGQKGAEAGTSLRNVLLKLSAPDALPKEAKKALDQLGVSLETLKDKTIPIQQRFEALKPLLNDDAALVRVFGQENIIAAKNVIGHTDRLKELTSKMYDYGTAQEQAATRSQTLQGKTDKLLSTYDSLILSMNEGSGIVSGFFKFFVEGATNGLYWLERMNDSWDELYEKSKKKGFELGQDYIKVDNKSMEQLVEMRKIYFDESEKIRNKIKDTEKELSEINPYAINIFGPSPKDLKKKLEELNGLLGQYEGAWEKTRTKINDLNKDKDLEFQEQEQEATKLTAEEQEKRLQEQEKSQKEAEKRKAEHLNKMKKLDDDSFALNKFRLEKEIEVGNEIAQNENELIDDRINAYLNAQQVEVSLAEETAAYKLRSISKYNDSVRDLTSEEIQTLINGGDIKKKLTDDEVLILEELQSKKEAIDKKDLENKQKIIDSIVTIEQKKVEKALESQYTELNKKLLNENQNFQDTLSALEGNQRAIEDATIDHEAKILKIKQDSAKEALQTQIDAQKALLENSNISAEVRAELLNKLSKLELELNQISVDSTIDSNDKKLLSTEEYNAKIKEMAYQLKDALIGFTNAIFDAKISKIDAELQANEEHYAREIELVEDDELQKKALEKQGEKRRKELEKEKRKEQKKQAILNKALAALEIGIQTSVAIVKAVADSPLTGGLPFSAIAAGIGAVQLATVLATPIPAYKEGTKGKPHKGGDALVGEVRPEVILEPGRNPYIVSKPSVLNLAKGTEVIPSVKEYQLLQSASIMASLKMEGKKMKNTEANIIFDNSYSKEVVDELKRNTEAVKKNKSNVILNNNVDIGYEIWKLGNTKWK